MSSQVLVWDLETVADLDAFARAKGIVGKPTDEVRLAIGNDFPKHTYHEIICIGGLLAEKSADGWRVEVLGAVHVGEWSEKRLIESFVQKIGETTPQLVTFNGASFDLPGPPVPGHGPRRRGARSPRSALLSSVHGGRG